jgi:hypothetical protein
MYLEADAGYVSARGHDPRAIRRATLWARLACRLRPLWTGWIAHSSSPS